METQYLVACVALLICVTAVFFSRAFSYAGLVCRRAGAGSGHTLAPAVVADAVVDTVAVSMRPTIWSYGMNGNYVVVGLPST